MDHLIIIPFHSKKKKESSKRLHHESWQVHRNISGTVRAEQKNTTHTSSTHHIHTFSFIPLPKIPCTKKEIKIIFLNLHLILSLSLLTSLTTVYSLISLPIFSLSLWWKCRIEDHRSRVLYMWLRIRVCDFCGAWIREQPLLGARRKRKNAVDEVSGTERVQFGGSGAVQSSW